MKTPIKTLVVVVVIIGTTALGARAQDKAKVSVEIDPATFVFNGYGVHLRLQPKNCKNSANNWRCTSQLLLRHIWMLPA